MAFSVGGCCNGRARWQAKIGNSSNIDDMNVFEKMLQKHRASGWIHRPKSRITTRVSWKNPQGRKVINKKIHKGAEADPYLWAVPGASVIEYKPDWRFAPIIRTAAGFPPARRRVTNIAYFEARCAPVCRMRWIDGAKAGRDGRGFGLS